MRRKTESIRFAVYLLLLLFVMVVDPLEARITLTENGQGKATIYVESDTVQMTSYAAREFQDYIEKVSGAKLPIERVASGIQPTLEPGKRYIFIGESAYTKKLGIEISGLKPDGFKIIAKDNWLAILGRDYRGKTIGTFRRGTGRSYDPVTGINMFGETGTLFGVYHFLEEFCGVRWFMPGELGEVVPAMSTIEIPDTTISNAPYIDYRHLMAYYIFNCDKEHVRWYRRAGFGGSYAASIIHSFQTFDKWAKDHPEYFYLDADGKPEGHLRLYLNEPNLIKDVVTYIRNYFKENPNVKIFPLMPKDYPLIPNVPDEELTDPRYKGIRNDSMGRYGNCSDYLWGFVNKVAKEVYKTNPDKLIGCCAYYPYHTPPTTIERLSPNVAVMICMTTGNHTNDKERAWFYEFLKEWHKKSKNIYFWDYASDYYIGTALPEMPVIYSHTIAREFEDLKKMLGNDWKGIFFEAESGRPQVRKFLHKEMLHLTYYVFSRYLWDPDLDIDALLSDYYEKFFGPVREEMKKYYELAEKFRAQKINKFEPKGGHYYNFGFNLDYTPEESGQLINHLKRAKEEAGDTIYGKRIALILEKVSGLQKKFAVTSKYPCVPLGKTKGVVKEEGLAAYWKFDEGEGKVTRDSSGNGNDGVVYNAKWLNTDYGSALEFNGENSAVEIRYPKNLDPRTNITVMGWFFYEKGNQGKTGLIWTDNYAYLLHIGRGIQFNFYSERGGMVCRTFGFTTRYLSIPGWNHITGSYDGKYLRIYLNGEKKAEERTGGNIRYTGDGKEWKYFKEFKIHIGASNFNTKWQKSFKGRIDEVKIYTRTLSDEEVKAEFDRGKEVFSKQ